MTRTLTGRDWPKDATLEAVLDPDDRRKVVYYRWKIGSRHIAAIAHTESNSWKALAYGQKDARGFRDPNTDLGVHLRRTDAEKAVIDYLEGLPS